MGLPNELAAVLIFDLCNGGFDLLFSYFFSYAYNKFMVKFIFFNNREIFGDFFYGEVNYCSE